MVHKKSPTLSAAQITELSKTMSRESFNLLLRTMLSREQKEQELALSQSKERLLDKKIKLASIMKSTIQEYAESCAENKYTPMAISSISAAFAAMTGENPDLGLPDMSVFNEKNTPSPPTDNALDMAGFDERVKKAESQGFRWNDRNEMPANKSTALKKIAKWESELEEGRNIDLESVCEIDYDLAVKQKSKAFIVGVCESLENNLSLGNTPLSPYLKRRFSALKEKYCSSAVEVAVQADPKVSINDQVKGLYDHIFKNNKTENHWQEHQPYLRKLFANRGDDIRKVCGATLGRLVCIGVYPPTVKWRDEEEKRRFERNAPGLWVEEQRKYYAPQLEALRDEYIARVGL